MGNSIGQVRVDLIADPSGIKEGIKQAAAELTKIAAVGAAIGNIVSKTLDDTFKKIKDTVSDAIGRADDYREVFEKLKIKPPDFATALAGSFDDVGDFKALLGDLQSKLNEAVDKPLSQAAISFRQLGIATRDASGNVRGLWQVFEDTTKAIGGTRDGWSKTALAVDVLGEKAKDAMGKLNELAKDGFQNAANEAKELGIGLSGAGVAASKAYSDANDSIEKSWRGIGDTIVSLALPALAAARKMQAEWMEEVAKSIAPLRDNVDAITAVDAAIKALLTSGILIKTIFNELAAVIAGPIAAIVLASQGDFSGAWEALGAAWRDMAGEAEKAYDSTKKLWTETRAAMDTLKQADKDESGSKGIQRTRISVDELKKSLDDAKKAGRDALQEILGSQWSTFAEKMAALSTALKDGVLRIGEYQNKVRELREKALQPLADAFENAFVDAVTGTKSLQAALNDLLKDVEKMIAKQLFKQLFGDLFSSTASGGGGILGSLFSGLSGITGKAVGGPVTAGTPYVIGEKGPELFFPETSGTIMPHDAVGRGGAGRNVTNVSVYNYSDASVETNTDQAGNLEITMRRIVDDQLGRTGGRTTMSNIFGVRPRVRSR